MKIPPSSSIMEEFGISLKIAIFSKILKTHYKMQISNATSSIGSSFGSLDTHYNNSLNTEVQKQNETKAKKLETKIVESIYFWVHCYTFLLIDIKFS